MIVLGVLEPNRVLGTSFDRRDPSSSEAAFSL